MSTFTESDLKNHLISLLRERFVNIQDIETEFSSVLKKRIISFIQANLPEEQIGIILKSLFDNILRFIQTMDESRFVGSISGQIIGEAGDGVNVITKYEEYFKKETERLAKEIVDIIYKKFKVAIRTKNYKK
jgi:hypothetical protein